MASPSERPVGSEPSAAGGPVELLLLDVGGPLYDDECYARALWRAVRELAGGVGEREFRAVYDEQRQRQTGSLRTAIAERFVPGADRAALSALARSYWEYPPGSLYADVLPTLRELAGKYRVALVANQRAHVRAALARDGVEEFVDIWALSEEVGADKPDPAIFQHALGRAGVPAARAVHVGNRLDTDVRGAHRVGLRTVWVLRGEAPPEPTPEQLAEPDAVVHTLTELPAALDKLQERR